MITLPGHKESELLFESERSRIYRVVEDGSGAARILKTPGPSLPVDKAREAYRTEFSYAKMLDSPLHLRYLAFDNWNGLPYLLTEDFGGVSLQRLIPDKGFDVDRFFRLALQLAQALDQLHQKRVIHKDICSSNVVVHPATLDLKLIDFGSASDFTKELGDNKTSWVHATLAYISPEQTGRINRLLTYKTDFYSLGVTFFQMLTGKLPFESEEPSELIYQHIAVAPPRVVDIIPSLPAQLDEIVMKMMRKNPDERYNSALGLVSDLEKAQRSWEKTRTIPLFPLGENDVPELFTLPEKIYGREEEIAQVKSYFNNALTGQMSVCYIEGRSGIGKSAFFTELYKDIVREKGHLGSGKFDQFQRNVPYSALIQALNQVIQEILLESAESVAKWKLILQEALGNNAGLLATVLPDLALIMGEIEHVEVSNPVLARNRFVLAFKNLIKGLSQPDAPLVLFLDDLQWIDAATLQLFTDFFNTLDRTERNYTLITGAYRDNEVGPDHPLALVLKDFAERGFPIRTIRLGPLGPEATNELCSGALGRSKEETRELMTLLHTRTGGSPFFIRQFLENLYTRGYIYLDREQRHWTWRIDKVRDAGFTDNVVDLIQQKLHKLSPDVQLVLKLASCLGKHFDATDIVRISGLDEASVNASLLSAMQEDIIYKLYAEGPGRYLFQHDRIQNAAYGLIDPAELDGVHHRIGRYLIEKPEVSSGNTKELFEGLGHLNRTESMVEDPALRLRLARLNLEAGNIARQSNAYEAANQFATLGIKFLPAGAWKEQPGITRDLHLVVAQSAYLTGDYARMREMADKALPNLASELDKASFHEIIAYSHVSRKEWGKTVEEVLKGLDLLGLHLPLDPSKMQVMKHLIGYFMTVGRRSTEDLEHLPDLKDPGVEAQLRLMISALSAAYMTNQNLFAILFIEMTRLSVKHGNSKYSSMAYVGYGVFFGGALGFIDKGFAYGQLGRKMFDKYRSDELQAKVYFSLYAFLQNWKVDVKELYPKLMEGFQVGAQVGENEYAAWCLSMMGGMSTLSGEPLEKVRETLVAAVRFTDNLKQIQVIANGFLDYAEWWLDTGDPEEDPLPEGYVDRKGAGFIEEKFWTGLAEHDLIYGTQYLYTGDLRRAWHHFSRGWVYHESLVGLFYYAQLAYFRALCAIKMQQEDRTSFSSGKLKGIIGDFRKWAVHSDANHAHKLKVFDAELAMLAGDRARGMDLMDEAIDLAGRTDHPNDQALYCEFAAGHLQRQGKKDFAELYLRRALQAYEKWGAVRKVRMLDAEYPGLRQRGVAGRKGISTSRTIITEDIFSTLDVESILKASQAISSENQVDALMVRLLKILTETGGAQRVVILLKVKDAWQVAAKKEEGGPVVTERTPLDKYGALPMTVIAYIEKTRNTVLLEHASEKGPFTKDPWIAGTKAKSILSIPIIRQGNLEGIMYMDNHLATDVFTSQRADILSTLSAQVAISLENANFISRMQELNRSYDRFVPKEFLHMLDRSSILDVRPGDQMINEMIILFADIRNFTALSETIPAAETFAMLNDYLSTVAPAIHDHGGTVDKFMGDGIMALFPNNADNALAAAVQMKRSLEQFNQKRAEAGSRPITIGIGLHIGKVILGTIGTDNRLNTTVIGDPVNLASRLESHTKVNKAVIQVSGELVAKLSNPAAFHLREVGNFSIKGKSNRIKLFEEYSSLPESLVQGISAHAQAFRSAIEQFEMGDREKATAMFETYLNAVPEDAVARYYLAECRSTDPTTIKPTA